MDKRLKETPSQTAGPYVHIGLLPGVAGLDVPHHGITNKTGLTSGTPVTITGVIRDGEGEIIKDAILEIWQAGADGKPADGHKGFARTSTDFETGEFVFETVKPGPLAWHDGQMQAPHLTLILFARGINMHLHTRVYFADESEVNSTDPVLQLAGDRQHTLLATIVAGSNSTYRFDIALQGDNETVFFDI